jgi:hypothetical protein
MKQRYGKWLADWRDASGTRHRKAFDMKKTAQRHQDRMQRESAEKKDHASATSPRSATRGSRRKAARARKSVAASPAN